MQQRSRTSKTSATATPARSSTPPPDQSSKEVDLPISLDSSKPENARSPLRSFDESFETAFQLTTLRGPLCNEPVVGMAYFVEGLHINEQGEGSAESAQSKISQAIGGLISSANDSFKQGLLDWSPRLLLAMYSCDIQASSKS